MTRKADKVADAIDYQVELAKAADLVPYANNTRTHDDEQIAILMGSIAEFGFSKPILVDKDGIIAGHGTVAAAMRLFENGHSIRTPGGKVLPDGYVPVVYADGWSKAQRKAYIIADNATAERAGWDAELLKIELGEIATLDFDINIIGFDPDALARMIDGPIAKTGKTDPDSVPDAPMVPASQLGDVWLMDKHRLMCGDATSVDDLEKLMAGGLADMGFSDPPYGLDYNGNKRGGISGTRAYSKLENDDLSGDALGGLIQNAFLFNKPEADTYICCSPLPRLNRPFVDFIEQCEREVEAVIVWDKTVPGLGDMAYRRQTEFLLFVKGKKWRKGDASDFDLWRIARDSGADYRHATQKPVALVMRAIDNSSKMGDTVLDLFGGSGSTLIACESTQRVARLMEISPQFVDVAVLRWQEFVGKPAILEATGQSYVEVLAERAPDAPITLAPAKGKKSKQ